MIDKIDAEILHMRETRAKVERTAKDSEQKISVLQSDFEKMKAKLEKEMNQLKEPLAVEIDKMRQENEQLLTAFEVQKNDYRELTGGFLKILSQQPASLLSQITDSAKIEESSIGPQILLKDKFLQKQVMMKTFYSERINSSSQN